MACVVAVDASCPRPTADRSRTGPLLYSRSPRRPLFPGGRFGLIASPARAADRVVGASGPPPRALSASTALVLLLLGGLALRLTIAYILFPASGFATDVELVCVVGADDGGARPRRLLSRAPASATIRPDTCTSCGPSGVLAQACSAATTPRRLATAFIKIPPMLVDIAVGYVLYRLVLGWAWPGRRAEALALGAAALYVFNPVTWYDSALWGQTDAAGALVVLLGVAALVRGNSEGAALLGVLAALVKPQFGVVLIPLVAVLLIRRHLLRPGSGPRRAPWGPAWLRGWLAREQGWVRDCSPRRSWPWSRSTCWPCPSGWTSRATSSS